MYECKTFYHRQIFVVVVQTKPKLMWCHCVSFRLCKLPLTGVPFCVLTAWVDVTGLVPKSSARGFLSMLENSIYLRHLETMYARVIFLKETES